MGEHLAVVLQEGLGAGRPGIAALALATTLADPATSLALADPAIVSLAATAH